MVELELTGYFSFHRLRVTQKTSQTITHQKWPHKTASIYVKPAFLFPNLSLLVPTAEGLPLLKKELRARWCHQYFISKSCKSPCPVALTSITNWFGEEKEFMKMPLDSKTLHGKNTRVMIDQPYRENCLR